MAVRDAAVPAIPGGPVPGETEYCLLGPLVVRRGGVVVPVPPGKQRALLAALLLRAGHRLDIAELTEALWGSQPPPSARVSLQNYVRRLRQTLEDGGGPVVVTQPGGYLIHVGPGALDVDRFESLLTAGRAAARAGAWAEAARDLGAALALWRGEPLADVVSDALTAREVPRLAELRLLAAETRIDAELHLGRPAEAIAELRQLTAAHPLRERLHALLMIALHRDGQRSGALAAYQAARSVLVGELGVEPGPELRRVQQQVLAGGSVLVGGPVLAGEPRPDPAGPEVGPEAGPLSRPAPGVRCSLPPDAAAFTGRDSELGHITAVVAEAVPTGGVVAIRAIGGMPGVGKTALAVHAAYLLRDRFPDRQLFIDLHAHTPGRDPLAPEAALAALLAAAGADPRFLPADLEGRAVMWRDRMAGQRALLVLDNAASSAQVTPLLPGGNDCLVLVSSRRHLADLPGAVVPVLLETLPPGQAREMFLRLAPRAAAGPAGSIAELARLAGFLPLAISLLARVYNRHPSWSLADLAAETRARLLTLTAENHSVAAAFEVSWRHLDAGQQDFFRRLVLHPGTAFDAYAAAALAGIPLAEAAGRLDTLHGEGLLTETGYRRYGMHDLIRRYAADRADAGQAADRDQAVGRLLDYYQRTAAVAGSLIARQDPSRPAPAPPEAPRAAMPDLPDSPRALAWLRAERASLLACLDHAARTGQQARLVALTPGVGALLRRDGPWTDAVTRHAAAVSAARHLGDRPGQADALHTLGIARRLTGDFPAATAALDEALGIFADLGDRRGRAGALRDLAVVRYSTSDNPGAARALGEALGILADLGDRHGQARVLYVLGDVRRMAGDYQGAARVLEEALAIFGDLGDQRGRAGALGYLGGIRRMTGDYQGAARVLEEALAIFGDLGERPDQASILLSLGATRQAAGDSPGAARALEDGLGIYRDLGSRLGQAIALGYLGPVRRVIGDYPGADRALGEALRIFRDLGDRGAQAEVQNELGALHQARGEAGLARNCHQQALDLARGVGGPWSEAHALAGLGRCALAAGDADGAAAGLRQAREIFERLGAAEAVGVAAELDALTRTGSAESPRYVPQVSQLVNGMAKSGASSRACPGS
jgi:DNA-binding SARP family transcriptional activator